MATKELKADPAIVNKIANQMSTCQQQIVNTFSNIKLEVDSLKNIWDSDSSRTFQTKFDGLQDDIQRMLGVAKEYSDDLTQISTTYSQIEQEAQQVNQTLTDDVFHV